MNSASAAPYRSGSARVSELTSSACGPIVRVKVPWQGIDGRGDCPDTRLVLFVGDGPALFVHRGDLASERLAIGDAAGREGGQLKRVDELVPGLLVFHRDEHLALRSAAQWSGPRVPGLPITLIECGPRT